MKLYHNPASPNCRKVNAVIEHIGLDVERVTMDFKAGDTRKSEFLALNPNGKVPVLVDGDLTLWESNVIMGYLCTKTDNTDLWPKSLLRYPILKWMNWEAAHFSKAVSTMVFEKVLKPFLGMGEPDEAKVQEGLAQFRQFGAVLNTCLEGKKYLVNDQLTIADFSVAASLAYSAPAAIPVDEFPHVQEWLNNLNEVPAWRATAPRF